MGRNAIDLIFLILLEFYWFLCVYTCTSWHLLVDNFWHGPHEVPDGITFYKQYLCLYPVHNIPVRVDNGAYLDSICPAESRSGCGPRALESDACIWPPVLVFPGQKTGHSTYRQTLCIRAAMIPRACETDDRPRQQIENHVHCCCRPRVPQKKAAFQPNFPNTISVTLALRGPAIVSSASGTVSGSRVAMRK